MPPMGVKRASMAAESTIWNGHIDAWNWRKEGGKRKKRFCKICKMQMQMQMQMQIHTQIQIRV
jgi:hypothetical protein